MLDKLMTWIIAAVIIGGVLAVFLVLGTALSAAVLTILWGWFITPVFGVPVPPWPLVVGLALIVNWFTQHYDTRKEQPAQDTLRMWLALVGRPLLTLACGWVLTRFI